jgi:hypothetical protein
MVTFITYFHQNFVTLQFTKKNQLTKINNTKCLDFERILSFSESGIYMSTCPRQFETGPGFDSRRNQIFLVAVGLERGPLSPYESK